MILDLLRADRRVDHNRVWIDHCEEHTIRLVLDEGYGPGLTLYPTTKMTPERAVDMVEIYGPSDCWSRRRPTGGPRIRWPCPRSCLRCGVAGIPIR